MENKVDVQRLMERYPMLGFLDIHYYGMKALGINYDKPKEGRPKLHLIDESYLFSIVPLIPDPESPYVLMGKELTFLGESLPFRVKAFKRSNDPYYSYFYFRSKDKWIQTLDSAVSLNLNFNPNCGGCSFCNRVEKSGLKNLSPKEGMQKLDEAGLDIRRVDELAIVTGMFRNEDETTKHITEVITLAKDKGFRGRFFYIGSQIKTPKAIKYIIDTSGQDNFRYAYTLESFTNRNFNHKKQESLEEAIENMKCLREGGLKTLEYTYIPGMDSLKTFFENAEKLRPIAIPHISIFRPAIEAHRVLPSKDFKENPLDYLCQMRIFFERLYGGPIYGNNLANLWPFPLSRLDPIFLSEKTNETSENG